MVHEKHQNKRDDLHEIQSYNNHQVDGPIKN